MGKEYSDSLEHIAKGEEMANHLYTARKWVNGKWQYIYNNAKQAGWKAKDAINTALGAEQRRERDLRRNSYEGSKQNSTNLSNQYRRDLERLNESSKNGTNNSSKYYEAKAQSDKTGEKVRDANIYQMRTKKLYDKAQADYDKTAYGKMEKAVAAAKANGRKAYDTVSENVSRAKQAAKSAGSKTLQQLGEAKNKAINKGREVLASLLNRRKKG